MRTELTPELKDETLHIRIAGIDAPEAAHFGRPAQPHSAESLDWLRETLMGKKVRCQLLRKDQYSRIVRGSAGVPLTTGRCSYDLKNDPPGSSAAFDDA